jgi:hypothetical protein
MNVAGVDITIATEHGLVCIAQLLILLFDLYSWYPTNTTKVLRTLT